MEFSTTQQNVSWILDRAREGSLDLKPPYQRRPVWTERQKCYLIESVLLSMPVPEIYLQVSIDQEGTSRWSVVDGQQRIRSLLQFQGIDPEEGEQTFNNFALNFIDSRSAYYGKSFKSLTPEERTKFFGYNFSVRYLTTDSETELRDMFTRLNKYSEELTNQELRNAAFRGPFIALSENLADDDYWAVVGIISPAVIRRMGDVEHVSELLISCIYGPQGGDPRDIDEVYERFEQYEERFPGQDDAHALFNKTLAAVQSVWPNLKSTRWRNRTDFYSLFSALAGLLRTLHLPEENYDGIRERMGSLDAEVKQFQADELSEVSDMARNYSVNVRYGVRQRVRRAERHTVLTELLTPFFVKND